MRIECNADRVAPRYEKYADYFSFSGTTGTIIKKNAPKEAICLYLREVADGALDCEELANAETLTNYMIDKFKRLDIYKVKTEKEREEIIEYIKSNPEPEKVVFTDENGNPLLIKNASLLK